MRDYEQAARALREANPEAADTLAQLLWDLVRGRVSVASSVVQNVIDILEGSR